MPRFMFRKPIKKLSPYKKNESPPEGDAWSSLSRKAAETVDHITKRLNSPGDLVSRFFAMGDEGKQCAILCIAGLSDAAMINEQIVPGLQRAITAARRKKETSADRLFGLLENEFLSVLKYTKTASLHEIMAAVLSGDTALLIDGSDQALLIGSRKWTGRSVEEPQTEALVRGPREGFNESLETNIILIRKNIRDPHLRFDSYRIGERAQKEMMLVYIDGIVHPEILQEAKRRVSTIRIDDVPESGTIEQWIEDSFLSPFPQILHTERPDKVAAAILQGKVIILLDGTPFALILPTTFVSLIQSPEDYYERWQIGTLIRTLRYVAVGISLILPSLYIALVSFHQGMIPSKLAFSIAAAREGVPFPAVVEAFLMELTLELLREAGVRLPKPIGQTIGIVGGLVIGDAAVQAGIVSPIMVIVVAVTAVSSFAIPSYSAGIAFRMLRFVTMIAAALFGLYGIVLSLIMLSIHLSRLQSFGIPYLTPIAPSFTQDWQDLIVRSPLMMLSKRPQFMQTLDEERISKEGTGK
ncbi:spore germination protein [Paenibacillus sp. FSL R5-0527]|uniref:spore germination protein n=1 Tax=Paenibacillus sp. FSL R5-0527 TaxID=2975321 RepID=UPI00097A375D|nr:spore germination protein [Paenibacillus macerans]